MSADDDTLDYRKYSIQDKSLDLDTTVTISTHSQESLRYGDSIFLGVSGTEPQSLKVVSSFISSSIHLIVTLDEYSYGDKPMPAPDLHMAAFRVLGPNKSQAQDELIKFRESHTKKLSQEEDSKLFTLKKEVETEVKENKSEQYRLLGKEILYGNVFQLQHHYTNKFIGVSDSQTAVVDRASLKVTLFETNGEHVQFKITPKYKVSNIGDKIRIEDQIVLENVKAQQYLHISNAQIKNTFYGIQPNSHEVNASAVDSPFSIYSHIRLHHEGESQAYNNIRGGSVLRLYHLQIQCYVVAAGSCGFEDEGITTRVVTDDVHLRTRQIKFGDLKPPSTSAITYWEIELARSPLSGDELKYEEPCRLKHLLTQRYLSVTKVSSKYVMKLIKLEEDRTGIDTCFIFRPFINEGKEMIDFESYARIYHPGTKTWIKASDELYEGESVATGPLALSGFRWDNATCFNLLVEPSKGYHDAFTLEEVEPELLSYFHYAMGYLPVIRNYLMSYNVEVKTTTVMERSLQSLADWMLDAHDKKDRKKRQKLLRNLGIIELLMEIQNRFREIPDELRNGPNYERRKNTTKKIYKVIEAYLTGESRKNENYTSKFIPIFESHFDLNINAEATLIELVRDNKAIISQFSQDFQQVTENLFNKLAVTRNSEIFYYFGVMCVADNNPIQENQIVLAKQLLVPQVQNSIFLMKLDDPDSPNPRLLATSPLKPEGYKLLSEYVSEKTPNINTPTFTYLLAQLDFFSNLCQGNNERAIKALIQQFPFEVVFAGLIDKEIHPLIRVKFAQLISTMFIDVGSNRAVLENLTLTFEYDKCLEDPGEDTGASNIALSGVENVYFPRMKLWFLNFFDSLVIYGKEDFVYTNQLIAAVLDMLQLFSKFGYYDDQVDADDLLKLLINILNGKKDKYYPKDPKVGGAVLAADTYFEENGRYKNTKANAPIFDVKIKCLQIFELFMNFRFFKRLQRLLFLYRVVKKEDKIQEARHVLDLAASPEDVLGRHLRQLHDPTFDIHEHSNLSTNAVQHLSVRILEYARYNFESYHGDEKFEAILLDLTQYENLDLVTTSLRLLNNQYMVENNLFEKAIQTQVLINPKSIEFFNETDTILPEFRRLLKASFTKSDSCNRLVEILVYFIQACELPNDKTEAHPQNQKILYNFGILEDVLNLLEKSLDDRAVLVSSSQAIMVDVDGPTRLAKVSCKLLQRMAQDNIVVQQRLYNRLEILVDQSLFDTAPNELASLLTQLFTGAQDIVMNVKSDDIRLICSLMRPRDTLLLQDIPPIIEILKAITKVEEIDLPLHFNQVHIMNNFIPIKPKRIDDILGTEEEKRERRAELLNSEKPEENDLIDLNLMLATYDLMASLCEGENLHHESVCQSMITLEELLEILNNKKMPFDRKFQFASFFNWVYLNTHKVSSGFDTTVDDDPAFWEFLENSSDVLSAMIAYLNRTSPEHAREIRKTIHEQGEASLKHDLSDTGSKSSMLFIASFDFGLINYLMKGILPIILVFYRRYFSTRPKEDEALKKYDPLLISFSICRKLFELSIKLQPFISTQYHAKLLYDAALSILTHPEIRSLPQIGSYIDNEELVEFSRLVGEEDKFVAQAIRIYQDDYQDEIELNTQFNNYVKHLRRAYWHRNTVKDQINGGHNSSYSEFLDPLCEHPSPDSMPLGPSFQHHLALFFTHTEDGCEVKKKFARSIVKQLRYSIEIFNELTERQKLKQERLDTKSLQLLRGAIHNEIMYIDPTLKDQNPVKFRTELEKVETVQSTIEDLDNTCIKALILIDHPSKIVSSQSIALLTDMLYGGNEYIQSQLEALAETREEKFFDQMEAILFYGGNSLLESRSLTEELRKRAIFITEMRDHLKSIYKRLIKEPPIPRTKSTGRSSPGMAFTPFKEPEEGDDSKPLVEVQKEGVELMTIQQANASLDVQGAPRVTHLETVDETDEAPIAMTRFEMIYEEQCKILQQECKPKSQLQGVTFQNSLRNIQVSFKLMGLMCDGQQKFLQDYFRAQPDNLENINMVIKTVQFLKIFYTEINQDNINLVAQVFRTLTEFISGNFENQSDAFSSKIMDIVNRIFQTSTFKHCSIEDLIDLYDSIIRMLQVMLEETSLSTKDLARDIFSVLDVASVHQVIGLLNDIRLSSNVNRDARDLAEDDMFRLFHFLIHLNDFEGLQQSEESTKLIPQEKDKQEGVLRAWNYCENRSKSVEVTYITEDNIQILNKVHFKNLDSGVLTDDVREKVKWEINRDSAEDKLRDFLDWFKAVKIDQIYHFKLRNTPVVSIYLKYQTWRKRLFLLWSVIINLFLLSTWLTPCSSVEANVVNNTVVYECVLDNPNSTINTIPPILPVVPFWYFFAFFPLGAIHLLLALDLLVLFYIVNGINFYIPSIFYRIIPVGFDKRNYRIHWKEPPERRYLQVNIIGSKVVFIWLIFLSSIISLPLRGYFYPLSLLYILERSDILRRVLLAVTKNGKSLIYVAIFGVIILYIFSVIAFALFYQQAQSSVSSDSEMYVFCHSLYECAISIGRWGLIETVGVILPQRFMEFAPEFTRIIYDIAFFIVITTIGLNIVFGIIVDTFSELRDEKYTQEKDMKSVCFICGIENYLFDRKGKGFKHHVKYEHNMWDYYSFFLYLDSVDPSDHTATESFVFKRLEENETVFFPQNAARSLALEENETAQELVLLANRLEEQSNLLREIMTRMKRMEKNKSAL